MCDEPKAMREIHEIRAALYEEMKNMSSEERARIADREMEEIEKRYGIKFKVADPRRRETVSR